MKRAPADEYVTCDSVVFDTIACIYEFYYGCMLCMRQQGDRASEYDLEALHDLAASVADRIGRLPCRKTIET
jgi:hypothetical protein